MWIVRTAISMKRFLHNIVLAAFATAFAAGCGSGKGERFSPMPFPAVAVPVMYAEDRDAAFEYVLMHYWDGLTDTLRQYPCDSSFVSGVRKADVEQAFADYAGLLGVSDIALARKSISRMYGMSVSCERKDTSSNVFETLTSLAELHLYDPNSPLRMEDIYGVYAGLLSQYGGFAPEKRAAYAYDAEMCSLNAVGTTAADFYFSDASGKVMNLHGISAEYTLLFFSNPGCNACKEIIDVLTQDAVVSGLVTSGRLAVVNVYIDEDIAEWYSYMPVYPSVWYNGYDPNGIIRGDTLYNVRAIPSLYLLDRQKTVIMKDAPSEKVFRFLADISR